MSRSRTVFMTGVWLAANQIQAIVQQVGIVPLFLHYWGDKLYGDWLEMASITFWFGIADAGMQSYIINRLTVLYAREEWPLFRKELASATLMYLVSVGLGLLVVVAGALALPLDAHLQATGRPLAGSAASIFALLGSWVLLQLLGGVVNGMYRVAGKADRSGAVYFFQLTAQITVTVSVLLLHGSAVQMAACYLCVAMAVLSWCLWNTRRLDVKLTPTLKGAEWRLALTFFGPSLLFLILNMGRDLTIQGMTVSVTEAIGAVAVVSFTTTRTLTGVLRMSTSALSTAMWPELTRMNARGEKDRLALAHSLLVKTTTSVTLMGAAVLCMSGADLYGMWTHRTANPLLLRLFLADALIGTPAFASVFILQATSNLRQMAFIQTAVGVTNVTACWFLVRRWGLPAAVASPIFFTVLVFGTWVPWHVMKFLGQPVSRYWRGIYWPAGWISAGTLAIVWCVHQLFKPENAFFRPGLVALACESVVAFGVVTLLAWSFLYTREESEFLVGVARRIARRSAPSVAS